MAEQDQKGANRIDEVVDLLFRHFLGRKADEDGLSAYRQAIRGGMKLEALVDSIASSEEARQRQEARSKDDYSHLNAAHAGADADLIVDLIYRAFLFRKADEDGKLVFANALRNGASISDIILAVSSSVEAQEKRFAQAGEHDDGDAQDGRFIRDVVSILTESGVARPRDYDRCKPLLQQEPMNRISVLQKLIAERVELREASNGSLRKYWLMGTDRFLTPEIWKTRTEQLAPRLSAPSMAQPAALAGRNFVHSGNIRVSAIASMYKGRKYIQKFLENIVSQTIFDQSELIIVDACSPEKEEELIRSYMEIYPNIVYKRFEFNIGIYDAWNYAASIARGEYLTNTNLDDLRGNESFEIQSRTLDENKTVDAVYQDLYYSLDHSFDFDMVAACGFKSNLPIATPNNMLEFNCLHNAPMWRKRLHDEVGYFDANYRSAGDYDFWLRCLKMKKTFLKVNTPHVVYYCNPEGISTAVDTPGVDEVNRARKRHAGDLISPYFQMSRKAFAREVGSDCPLDPAKSDYDLVQKYMRSFSAQARMDWPGSPRSRQSA
ncbi:glycosyltransferase [Martelella lutilitoris]|nr:glycosyltransferase [Martelella lutilitoris]